MKIIEQVQDFLSQPSTGLANSVLNCPYCGRPHKIPYQEIVIGPGVINQVPELAQKALGRRPRRIGVVYDLAIEAFIQKMFFEPFTSMGLPVVPVPLGAAGEWLDSSREVGDGAVASLPDNLDLLIAAGSGVICDLTKWIATYAHKPFILCGTAPSMNGYTSITAVIAELDIKLTKYVDFPYAVVLDTTILATAPDAMIQAGVGDLAARAICNADWKLSNFLHNSYFCPLPYQMTAQSEKRYLQAAAGIQQREPQAIATLAEAISISGLSMSILDGETSPSSGGEHVISHYWDLMNHLEGAPRNLHGAQVGVGTMMMLAAYQIFRDLDVSHLDPQKIVHSRLSLEQIQAMNTARFGAAAGPLNETSRKKYLPPDVFEKLIHKVIRDWDALWTEITPYTASLETIRERLKAAGLPLKLETVQRTPQQAVDALLFGGRYRPRFTFLDLAWDLGLFPGAADQILELAGVL